MDTGNTLVTWFYLQFNIDNGPEIKASHRLGVFVEDPEANIPIATQFKVDFELEQSYGKLLFLSWFSMLKINHTW